MTLAQLVKAEEALLEAYCDARLPMLTKSKHPALAAAANKLNDAFVATHAALEKVLLETQEKEEGAA